MNKKSAGFCKVISYFLNFQACYGDVDNFSIVFPSDADDDEKNLIMMGAIFTDYMYFEDNSLIESKADKITMPN